MKNDVIPDTNRIARFCRPRNVDGNEILSTAFMPRVVDTYLSVNWVEYLGQFTAEAEQRTLRELYGKKFSVGATARIALLNVGHMRGYVHECSPDKRDLAARHEPISDPPEDPSHSGVFNLRHDDELIAELIAQAVLESFPAR